MKFLIRFAVFFVVASFLSVAALAGPAAISSEGKESKMVAPVPAPECSWQGFYLGLNVGGTFGESEATDIDDYNSGSIGAKHWDYDVSGFVGGIEAGYNFQPMKWLVLGVETDFGYLGLDGSAVQPGSPGNDTIGETSDGFYATLRGRVGVAFNRFLVYGTGGGIGANNEVRVFDHQTAPPGGLGSGDASSDDFRLGWTVGGGVAYAINCHWSVKVEYLYYNLEEEDFSFVNSFNSGTIHWDTETDGHIVRAGLAYKF